MQFMNNLFIDLLIKSTKRDVTQLFVSCKKTKKIQLITDNKLLLIENYL